MPIPDTLPIQGTASLLANFIPIPGIGVVIGAILAAQERGKAEDFKNFAAMRNAIMNNTLRPLANAVQARDYDLAVSYFPQAPYNPATYYMTSLEYAPAAANAWYVAALGYALEHNDFRYIETMILIVDTMESAYLQANSSDRQDASE